MVFKIHKSNHAKGVVEFLIQVFDSIVIFYNGHDGSSLQKQSYFRSSRLVKRSDDCEVTYAFAGNRNGNVVNRTQLLQKAFHQSY